MNRTRLIVGCWAALLSWSCADVIELAADAEVDMGVADMGFAPVFDSSPETDVDPIGPTADGGQDAAVEPDADAMPPGPCMPSDEVCNGMDDDCDGSADEGAVCCAANTELCNGLDDDCDGEIDEGADCCEPQPETCSGVDDDCDGEIDEGDVCCGDEVCNGTDDDCDGEIDEGAVCCDPVDELCDEVDNDCDGQIDEGDACCAPETCNGVDDDCDGRADEERVCGLFVQGQCRLFLGWADERRGPANASPTWGQCPGVDRFNNGDVGCVGTRYDGLFARLSTSGDVNDDDQFGLAFVCRPDQDADLASWVQTHCALFMGYADENRAPAGGASFGNCPPQLEVRAGNLRCTSTGFDGRFRPLNTQGDVDDNDDLSFAWKCNDDPDRPGLAASVQAQVEVFAGWADERRGPADGSAVWSTCPNAPNPSRGEVRCVGTRGDGQFHRLDLIGDVNGDDQAGIALRAR